ncbi:MAG: hypothetical protein WB681_07540 [Candidatus Cybelea sp.]
MIEFIIVTIFILCVCLWLGAFIAGTAIWIEWLYKLAKRLGLARVLSIAAGITAYVIADTQWGWGWWSWLFAIFVTAVAHAWIGQGIEQGSVGQRDP